MRTLLRNKRKIYLCKKYVNENGVTLFKEPLEVKINYEPVTSSFQELTMGNHYGRNYQAIVDLKVGSLFSTEDRCYIDVEPPEEHNELCEDADYIVDVLPQKTLNNIKIVFRRLSGVENEKINI